MSDNEAAVDRLTKFWPIIITVLGGAVTVGAIMFQLGAVPKQTEQILREQREMAVDLRKLSEGLIEMQTTGRFNASMIADHNRRLYVLETTRR